MDLWSDQRFSSDLSLILQMESLLKPVFTTEHGIKIRIVILAKSKFWDTLYQNRIEVSYSILYHCMFLIGQRTTHSPCTVNDENVSIYNVSMVTNYQISDQNVSHTSLLKHSIYYHRIAKINIQHPSYSHHLQSCTSSSSFITLSWQRCVMRK